ncbi:MAG: transporter [Verrucomicrobia bacterium]|nr:transporter [Verrucomicrobiota bacterium]
MRRPLSSLLLSCALCLAGFPLAAQVTESPHTVAPGRVLLEVDGVRLAVGRDGADGGTLDALAVGSTLLTTGLTRSLDLQVGVDLFLRQSVSLGGQRDSDAGFGDVRLRTKWTFWRLDSGAAALALIPYVRLPTSTAGLGSERMDGGLILPWASTGPAGVVTGAMLHWNSASSADGRRYQWSGAAYARRDLFRLLSAYAEVTLAAASGAWAAREGTVGAGALLRPWDGLEIDYQIQRGLNRRAPDWIHSLRFNWDW